MTIKDIVEVWLTAHGYDGLYWRGYCCGCKADDLMPCGETCEFCQPGYLQPCTCEEGHDWHIGGVKAK